MRHDERREPSMVAHNGVGFPEPGFQNFDSIGDVLALARDVAENDYARHLAALRDAQDDQTRKDALEALDRSVKASQQVSQAQQYLLMSRDSFKQATSQMLHGNETGAAVTYQESGSQMQKAANNVRLFADYAPQSKLFNAALAFVAKRDEMFANLGTRLDTAAASVEAKIARTGAGFSRGLKAFATGMQEFGSRIAKMPEVIGAVARERAISTSEATTRVASGMLSRARSMIGSIREGIDHAKTTVEQKFFGAIDSVDNVADKLAGRVHEGVNAAKDRVDLAGLAAQNQIERVNEAAVRARMAAWECVDRLANAANELKTQVKSGVVNTTEAVERHARATVAVASGGAHLIRMLGNQVGERYNNALDDAAQQQKTRSIKGP